jgi:hypothetical protein
MMCMAQAHVSTYVMSMSVLSVRRTCTTTCMLFVHMPRACFLGGSNAGEGPAIAPATPPHKGEVQEMQSTVAHRVNQGLRARAEFALSQRGLGMDDASVISAQADATVLMISELSGSLELEDATEVMNEVHRGPHPSRLALALSWHMQSSAFISTVQHGHSKQEGSAALCRKTIPSTLA